MVKLESAVIARLEKAGERFEVLVEPNLAQSLKKGENVDFNELLASDTVFKDAAKGEEQSDSLILKVLGTSGLREVVTKIVRDGSVQLTTEQRKKMKEKKHREIIEYIARNAVNPQTNAPHPAQRIETAMSETGVSVDPLRSVQDQMPEILGALKKLLPISLEKMKLEVLIPAAYAAKSQGAVRQFELKQEKWLGNGDFVCMIEIPAGLKNEFLNKLNKASSGEVQVKVLE